MSEFNNKTVFITGGNSGIGKATAIEFAKAGANVVITGRREKEGEEAIAEMKQYSEKVLFIQMDVCNEKEVEEAIQTTVSKFGKLDYAFNNAGINLEPNPIHELDMDNWTAVINTNLTGVILCMKYEIREMLKQGHGSIVNMSSAAGLISRWFIPVAYNASKHAVIGVTKNAAIAYAQQNIRVNAVCPAVIQTPLIDALPAEVRDHLKGIHPVGRYGTLEEVANTVMFLCSDKASFVTGQSISIDGGMTAE